MGDVLIRTGEAGDEPLVSWSLETATYSMFSQMLGAQWSSILNRVIARDGNSWSVGNARIAEVDGVMLGVALSAPASTPEPDLAREVSSIIGKVRLGALTLIGWPFLSFMEHHEPGEWYLTALAVRAEARGRGVGTALLRDTVQRAHDGACSTVALYVEEANPTARRLYETEGFTVTGRSRRAWLYERVVVERMSRPVVVD